MSDNRPIIIQQVSAPQPKWNKGTAGVLSFLIPGMGQLYKGKPISGILWFVFTILGYLFIVPGMVLHVMCVVLATMGDPNR